MPPLAHSVKFSVVDTPLNRALFWDRVAQTAGTESCWPWLSWLKGQYGGWNIGTLSGNSIRAHRVAFYFSTGIDPIGNLNVLHTCDNPRCCNPAHLYAGSHKQNMADRTARGRLTTLKGEYANRAKLTDEKVVEIREGYKGGGTLKGLAKLYGVDHKAIYRITMGVTYKDSGGPIRPY